MYRVSEMIGKPVVSVTTGEKLGTVADALLEPGGAGLIALVLGSGMLGKEHVLPLSDIERLGRDTVLASTDEHLMSAGAWRRADVEATRSSSIRGRRVVTGDGREVGHVRDFFVDEQTGAFGGLEVESRSLGGLRSHRTTVPASPAPRIGPDVVVVDAAAVDRRDEGAPTDRQNETR